MKLAYTTLFVASIERSLAFYRAAFGLERRFVHESGQYAELDTGTTALAFAAHDLARTIVKIPYRAGARGEPPAGFELGLETGDVPRAYERAVAAGALPVSAPERMPWGQTVAYVRDPDGVLVVLVSEIDDQAGK
jgi:catechol 2,3-dioxygenase-like lactoylglutathione lyase family enzyme